MIIVIDMQGKRSKKKIIEEKTFTYSLSVCVLQRRTSLWLTCCKFGLAGLRMLG